MSKSISISDRLGVCSWSLRPQNTADLIEKVSQTGLHAIQLALDPVRTEPEDWGDISEAVAATGMRLISGMIRTIGEDYSTLESIRRTGGVVPDETWDQNWINIQENAKIAKDLQLPLVTFHAGFLPEDKSDPKYPVLLDRLRKIADLFAEYEIDLGFETGQETAETLEVFLDELDRPNVGVNFDPANMLINGMGDPIEALNLLLPRLKQVHIKDGSRPKEVGSKGKEEVVGTGEVDWKMFLITLRKGGYTGDLVIEREQGDKRIAEIRQAAALIRQHAEVG
ncbi:MAG TPA: sugar phosphate isomerase/epimerase family protein [Opitutales bacterium]|nr:sugar phosphate isomerase/epimerase family protein [Opitutales bacterium]